MLFLQDFDQAFLATPGLQMGPADVLSHKDEIDTSNNNQDVVLLSSSTKLLTLPYLTHSFLLLSMHWMMGNHSLPEHPNMTGTMTKGNYTSRIDYISLNLPDRTWYQPSMPVKPTDMVVYFAPSTCFSRTIGG